MSESPQAPVFGNAAGGNQEILSAHSIEAVLGDFRVWLQQTVSSCGSLGLEDQAALAAKEEPVDLNTLLGQFLGLKHEVNLQTRAVRGQQEQNAETLKQLSQALQALRQGQTTADPSTQRGTDEQLRPLLKSLVDLYDALAPAEREVTRVSRAILPELDGLAPGPLADKELPRRSWLGRLFGRPPTSSSSGAVEQDHQKTRLAIERVRQLLGSLLTGYTMSVQRVERALQQQGLETMPVVGQPFDPERMEVVEVVADSGRPAGEVIEEVRRGYLWRGRVFRYAQVRVAKP